MTGDAAHSFLVVCEGTSDPRVISILADRIACAQHDWLDGIIEMMRRYVGATPQEAFVQWCKLSEICKARRIPPVHGQGYSLGRRAALMALRLASTLEVQPSVVLLVHDADGDHKGWRESLKAARSDFHMKDHGPAFAVVIGVAQPEREAWVLAGFHARTPEEESRLQELRADLGFNPCEHGERLTSSRETDKKDAKRALGHLIGRDSEREMACLRDTPLDILKARGKAVGLCAFLEELEARLAPCYIKP